MRRSSIAVLSFLSVFAVATRAVGEEPRALVKRALDAVGGLEKLQRCKASRTQLKGVSYEQGQVPFKATIWRQFPSKYRFMYEAEIQGEAYQFIQVWNDKAGWAMTDGNPEPLGEANLRDMEVSAYADYVESLVPLLTEKEFSLAPLADAEVEGRPAFGVSATAAGKPEVRLYFDKETAFLVKSARRRVEPDNKKDLLHEELFLDYRTIDLGAADERILKEAKLPSDGPALLEFLRERSLDSARRDQIIGLVKKLGDNAFEVREKAKSDLIALAKAASDRKGVESILNQESQNPDPEVAARAKECLDAIGKAPDPSVAGAVVRLIGLKRPEGTIDALLAYLPTAADKAVAQEVRRTLQSIAYPDGKPDPALVRAAESTDPFRRAEATAALGSDAKVAAARADQRLFLGSIKYAMKGLVYENKKKTLEVELTDIQFFNQLDERLFQKP